MKCELNLLDIQQESIRILSYIDKFCEEHDISYSLGYGALIGAIRHKGFIPWDDDIDIIMTRPEYERFVQIFSTDGEMNVLGLQLYAPELGNSYFGISRICDMRRTLVKKYYNWTDDDTGLWIDVFVIDALPNDNGESLRRQNQKCFHSCGACVPLSLTWGLKRLFKTIAKRLLYGNKREQNIRKYLDLIRLLPPYDNSKKVCNCSSPYREKDIHDKIIFDKYMRIPFGDIEVCIIEKYDEYLRNIYGDYMQLPPLNQRVRGHSNSKYYWK